MNPSLIRLCPIRPILLAAVCLSSLSAETLYTNPHPVPLVPTWHTWASTIGSNGTYAATYDSFQVPEPFTVTEVSWVGCYIDQSQSVSVPPTPLTTSWEISFYGNNGNQPGTKFHSQNIPLAQVTSVYVSDEIFADTDGDEPVIRRKYTALLPTPVALPAGTLWFSPRSLQPVFNPHFSWMSGASGGDCIQISNSGGGPEQSTTRSGNRAFTLIGHPTPPAPGISVSVASTVVANGGDVTAPGTNLGTERNYQVTISNPDQGTLENIAASITPAGNSDFRIGPLPPSATVNPGGSTSFLVIFSPQALGSRSGTLQITSNAVPSPYVIQFSGTGSDTELPVISPQAIPLNLVDGTPGNAATVGNWLANYGGASATDNSGSVNWSHNYTALPPVGSSTTVTFTATDPSGNEATTTAALHVLDQTPPSINTPPADLQVICDDPDRAAQITAWLASQGGAAATDNSGSFTWSHNYTSQPGPCGNVTVTFTAKDASNNQSTTTAKIFVLDITPPDIGSPAVDLTVESDGSGNTSERAAWLNSHGGATASDTCSSVTWTHSFTSLPNNLPQTVPVTFTAKDSCGQPSTTTASFIIQDTTPPQLTAPATDFYGDESEAASDLAAFLNSRGGATAVDIAGPVTWTNNYSGTPPPVRGYITVTFTATDTVGLSVSSSSRFFLFPPGAVWTGPADSFWSLGQNWRIPNGVVPDGSRDCYVDLFDFQNTRSTANGNYGVKDLYIGAGDAVELAGSITVHGSLIRNDGIFRSRRATDNTGSAYGLGLNGPVSLEGSGKLFLSRAGHNVIYPTNAAGANGILTVGAQQEIATEGATTGGYQGTSIHAGLVNHGTVSANGGSLNFYSLPKANSGFFRAINGGYLEVQTPVNNTGGTVFAGAGSIVALQQGLTGGTVTGTGRMQVTGNASLNGPMLLDSGLTTALDGGNTWLKGTITNNSLVALGSATSTSAAVIRLDGPVTLDGSGSLLFQNNGARAIVANTNAATDILTLGAQQEITTDHRTTSNYQSASIHAGLVNHGTLTVDAGALNFYSQTKVNEGVFRAINGGYLEVQAPVNNTGGTVLAGAGSIVALQQGLTGGTVTGTGKLRVTGNASLNGPMLLDSGLTTALDGGTTWLNGTITNNSLMALGSATTTSAAVIRLDGPVTLDGSGKLLIQNDGARAILANTNGATDILTLGAQQEITTDHRTVANYQAASIHAGLVNHGTLTVDAGALNFYSQTKVNEGVFRAINGGYLQVQAPVNNTGGTVLAGPDSIVALQQGLFGGTVTGTGKLQVTGNASLNGPMLLDSGLTTALDGGTTWLNGTITNNGLVTVGAGTGDSTSYVLLDGPVNLDGHGKMLFQNTGRRQILANTNAATDILTIGAQQEITTDHRTTSNYQATSIHARLVNQGTLTADEGQLSLYAEPKTNHGTMRAINGGFLNIDANVDNTGATLFAGPDSTLYADRAITGGTITGTGELRFATSGDLVGPITLDAGLTTNLVGQGLGLTGDITLNGTLNVGSDTSTNSVAVYINGPVNLQGSGKVVFRNQGARQILYGGGTNHMLTVGPNIEITTDGRNQANYQAASIHATAPSP